MATTLHARPARPARTPATGAALATLTRRFAWGMAIVGLGLTLVLGGCGARKSLAKPIDDTLYFSGEATASHGESGTFAGALISGYATANLV